MALSILCVARNVNIGRIVAELWDGVPSFLVDTLTQLAFTQVRCCAVAPAWQNRPGF